MVFQLFYKNAFCQKENDKYIEADFMVYFKIMLLLYILNSFIGVNTKIKLRVQGLTNSQIQSGAYALILAEENGLRRIPIIVGTAEAQSIAIALEEIIPPRPLTHDLFANFSKAFDIDLQEVFIYKFEEGVFYSRLLFTQEGREVLLDSRTSDAIAIALRTQCEIYTTEEIMQECGVVLEESLFAEENELPDPEELEPGDIKDEGQLREWLFSLDADELKERLEAAIASENYENAKMYKDELRRREEQ